MWSPFQDAVRTFALKLMHYTLRDPIIHWNILSLTLLQNTNVEYTLILNIKSCPSLKPSDAA